MSTQGPGEGRSHRVLCRHKSDLQSGRVLPASPHNEEGQFGGKKSALERNGDQRRTFSRPRRRSWHRGDLRLCLMARKRNIQRRIRNKLEGIHFQENLWINFYLCVYIFRFFLLHEVIRCSLYSPALTSYISHGSASTVLISGCQGVELFMHVDLQHAPALII